MNSELVSICIPNYNCEKYLDICLNSAINQTYSNKEIVFIDGCSNDSSLQIAEKYKDKIKIIKNTSYIEQARNTKQCIKYSKGKYIVILHSDDFLLPNFIEKLISILDSHQNVGMVIGERMETDESGISKTIAPFYNKNCIIPGEKQAKVFMMSAVLPCQVLFKRDIYNKSGGIDEKYNINLDGLLWFKLSLISDVGYIQDPVSVYRRHNESTTSKYNKSIDLIIEHYRTLKEIIKVSEGNIYLKQYFDEAIKRTGYLTLRYSHNIFKQKNFDLVKKYIILSTVFDPEIVNTDLYKTLKYCSELKSDNYEIYQKLIPEQSEIRKYSYDPPEGYIEI